MDDSPVCEVCDDWQPAGVCKVKDCTLKARWKGQCYKHNGNKAYKCKFHLCEKAGCIRGFCQVHSKVVDLNQHSYEAQHLQEYELVRRLVRDRRLRKNHLQSVLKKQKFKCADPHKRCYTVINGKATSRCPFTAAGWKLPRDMAELDHIVPLSEGGTNHVANLQVLCACCHAAKSHAERNKA